MTRHQRKTRMLGFKMSCINDGRCWSASWNRGSALSFKQGRALSSSWSMNKVDDFDW